MLHIYTRVIVFVFCLMASGPLIAQFSNEIHIDVGETNVSEGMFAKTALISSCFYKRYHFEAGIQLNLKSCYNTGFSGFQFNAMRELNFRRRSFELQALMVYKPVSDIVNEFNWGLSLNFQRRHFAMILGNNFRTISISKKAQLEFGIENTNKIREYWNLMYSFSYTATIHDNKWNVTATVTNIDEFSINQETNPLYKFRLSYKAGPTIYIYSEPWYETSGAANLHVDYFGFFVRNGILWNIYSPRN